MTRITMLLIAGVALLGGCATTGAQHAYAPKTAVCVLRGTSGNESVSGQVMFTQQGDGVMIDAVVSGLKPGSHGFHVHEFGDVNCSDGKCTGGHFNPYGMPHGGPAAARRHVGDFGNLVAGTDGVARYRRTDHQCTLDMSRDNCIIGRAIIVHADPDDMKSQPTGAAGSRVAAGVIGVGAK